MVMFQTQQRRRIVAFWLLTALFLWIWVDVERGEHARIIEFQGAADGRPRLAKAG